MTPTEASASAREICQLAPVVPVIVVSDLAHARPLAEALVAGGLPALEVTLRTPVLRGGTPSASGSRRS